MPLSSEIPRRTALELRRRAAPEPSSPDELDLWLQSLLAGHGLKTRSLAREDPRLAGGVAAIDTRFQFVYTARDLGEPERRFALAHELGHCLLHRREDNPPQLDAWGEDFSEGTVGYSPQERREAEANAFARALLVASEQCSTLAEQGISLNQIASHLGIPVACVRDALLTTGDEGLGQDLASAPIPFDPSQWNALIRSAPWVRVEAGPGTGKTQVLVGRISHLVQEKGFDASGILVLTFSRAACGTVRERLVRNFPDWGGRVSVSTLHSYGLDLIRRFSHQLDLPLRPLLLSKADMGWVLTKLLADFPVGDLAQKFPEALANALADWLGEPTRTAEPELAQQIRAGYALWKRRHGAVDYRDMIAFPLQLLTEQPAILETERARYRSILVDESQDLDREQAQIIAMLGMGTQDRLWMVGDPGQRIYGFRGAGNAVVVESDRVDPQTPIALDVNYRSLPAIVRALGDTSLGDPDRWTPARHGAGKVTVAAADSDRAQNAGVARTLEAERRGGRPWSDMAVLSRTHGLKGKMRDALRAAGIPVREERDDLWLTESPCLRVLERMTELATGTPLPIDQDLDLSGLVDSMLWGPERLVPAMDARERVRARALIQLVHAYQNRRALYRLPSEHDLSGFLRFARLHRESGELPGTLEGDFRQEDAVLLTTIHAAKGREFGLVVLPDLNHSVFPPQSRGFRLRFAPHGSDPEEEKRLFFVGLSRAKDSVLVSYIEGRGKKKSTLLDSLRVVTDRLHWRADDVSPVFYAPLREAEHLMVDVRELVRWQRCSAQSVYERGTIARGSADSGYPLFHATIVASLQSDNPSEAFDRLWSERSRLVPEPLRAYYRHLAKRHVGDCEGPLLFGGPIERVVDVGNGTVTVRADGMDRDGRPVRVRIKRAPNRNDSSNDLTDFLLLTGFNDVAMHLYPMQQHLEPVQMTVNMRSGWHQRLPVLLEDYRNGVGKAQPADELQCLNCPHWYRCPRDGSIVAADSLRQGRVVAEGNASP